MSLLITAFAPKTTGCQHYRATIAVEAQGNIVADTTLDELDSTDEEPAVQIVSKPAAITDLQCRAIVLQVWLWARYRRRLSRTILNVVIA